MAGTQFQHRRGTQAECDAFTGAAAELFFDTTNKILRVSDGATQGGYPLVTAQNLIQRAPIWCGTAGGTANALTLTVSPGPVVLGVGMTLRFIVGATNTGAATVAVNGGPPQTIQSNQGAALIAGFWQAGEVMDITWTGSLFKASRANVPTLLRLGEAVPSGTPTYIIFALPTGYSQFQFDFEGLAPTVDATPLAQVSIDGGTNYLTGGTDYGSGWYGGLSPGFAAPSAAAFMTLSFAAAGGGAGVAGRAILTPAVAGAHATTLSTSATVSTVSSGTLGSTVSAYCASLTRPTHIRFAFNTTTFLNRGKIVMSGIPT